MMDTGRRPEHARKPKLEALLQDLNDLLAESEGKVMERFKQPDHPVVFIMGCARSGTTLLLQYLAATGAFSYPSNLIARFYNAPYIGARIQQEILTDSEYDCGGELTGGNTYVSGDFSSCLGKTKGLLSPSEFWYFWRRFVPPQEIQSYAEDTLGTLDMRSFVAEISALESVRGLPVLMKGLYLNWNIKFLSQLFDKAVFIHIHRHPLYNMHSLLRARARFFGGKTPGTPSSHRSMPIYAGFRWTSNWRGRFITPTVPYRKAGPGWRRSAVWSLTMSRCVPSRNRCLRHLLKNWPRKAIARTRHPRRRQTCIHAAESKCRQDVLIC